MKPSPASAFLQSLSTRPQQAAAQTRSPVPSAPDRPTTARRADGPSTLPGPMALDAGARNAPRGTYLNIKV